MKPAYNPNSNLSLETLIHIQALLVRDAEHNLKAGALLYPNHIEGWQRGLKYEQDKLTTMLGNPKINETEDTHGTFEMDL